MQALGQGVEHIGRLVNPAPLYPSLREHLAQGRPEPQGAVTDGHYRRGQAPLLEAAEHLRPAVGGLPVPVGDRNELLGPVGADPHDDQATQPVLLQADVEVDPVGPPVHIVERLQAAPRPPLVLGLPCLGESADRGCRQAGLGAEEGLKGRGEVGGGEAPKVQDGQDLGDLRRAPHVRRQDGRGKPLPVAPVVHPRGGDVHHAGTSHHLTPVGVAVAHHHAEPGRVKDVAVGLQVDPAFGLQRQGEHLGGGDPAQFVEVDRHLFGLRRLPRRGVMRYLQRQAYSFPPAPTGDLRSDA